MKFCKNLQKVVELSDQDWAPYWTNYKLLKVSPSVPICVCLCRTDGFACWIFTKGVVRNVDFVFLWIFLSTSFRKQLKGYRLIPLPAYNHY